MLWRCSKKLNKVKIHRKKGRERERERAMVSKMIIKLQKHLVVKMASFKELVSLRITKLVHKIATFSCKNV